MTRASSVLRSFRLCRIRCNYQLRSQEWLERPRSVYVKTKYHQNDCTRRNHLFSHHLHVSPDSHVLSYLRKGKHPSQPIHHAFNPFFFIQPTLQLLPAIGNDVFLPIMISRLMISLKKAAIAENGWSFSEMTTARRVDEMRFAHWENSGRTRPSLEGYRARKVLRTSRTDDLDQISADFSEDIGMGVNNRSEGPIVY